ncbi:MAG: hypothetical protein LLG04_06480 [Parachlamydia sp.]|nr:hypothetical protein [Parachlamydia sp.]
MNLGEEYHPAAQESTTEAEHSMEAIVELPAETFEETSEEAPEGALEGTPEVASVSASDENPQREMSYKQAFEAFTGELDKLPDAESRLNRAIAFMEAALSQGGTPHFKSFWEARGICVELFKQNINPISRSILWAKYSDLSKEARRLKDLLEEQSAFAAEQIEIAIAALEKEIESNPEILASTPLLEFAIVCKSLDKRRKFYAETQQELQMLNAHAARINALRKELIKTEMRIKLKNRFFQRLSLAGDKVFPRRKELIKAISQYFVEDVDSFIAENFKGQEIHDSLFFLREEIKSLQGMAKVLTLNTHAFSHTRMRLSQCWDSVKEVEKERKKVRVQQKAAFKQNYDQLHSQIESFKISFAEKQIHLAEAQKKLDEIAVAMRQIELGRDEVKQLKEELGQARQPVLEQLKAAEIEKQQHLQEKENQRKKGFQDLLQQCEELLASADQFDSENLFQKREDLLAKVGQSTLSKVEKQELERKLKPLRDLIAEKKEQALLALSEDDRNLLQQLKDLLKEKRDLRQEIKAQIEFYRKAVHGSGLDFEQSMNYNAQMASEKERLEKINQGIREIETKIEEIESA